jgi:hypothetical protein
MVNLPKSGCPVEPVKIELDINPCLTGKRETGQLANLIRQIIREKIIPDRIQLLLGFAQGAAVQAFSVLPDQVKPP